MAGFVRDILATLSYEPRPELPHAAGADLSRLDERLAVVLCVMGARRFAGP